MVEGRGIGEECFFVARERSYERSQIARVDVPLVRIAYPTREHAIVLHVHLVLPHPIEGILYFLSLPAVVLREIRGKCIGTNIEVHCERIAIIRKNRDRIFSQWSIRI